MYKYESFSFFFLKKSMSLNSPQNESNERKYLFIDGQKPTWAFQKGFYHLYYILTNIFKYTKKLIKIINKTTKSNQQEKKNILKFFFKFY